MEAVLLIGRAVFGLVFIYAGVRNLVTLEKTAAGVGSKGLPQAKLATLGTSPLLIASGLSILLGFYAWVGAILLVVFLAFSSLLVHRFWAFSDPEKALNEQFHFEKNMALIGAALLIWYFGSGPYSLN
ncbi:MAG: DoxX family protein [Dehalococcoidia bacterium]